MEEKKSVHIMAGNIISTNWESARNSKSVDLSKLSELFTQPRDEEPEKKPKERTTQVKEITPKNLNNLDSIDIKDKDWEKISLPTRGNTDSTDTRSIKPARSAETTEGTRGYIKTALDEVMSTGSTNSLFNDEFTNEIIDSARNRRNEREERKQKPRDWEVQSKAPTTADIPANQMGFAPARSAFKPAPLPEVKIKEIDEIAAARKMSAEAGNHAAQLKEEVNKIFKDKFEKDFNDTRNWEEQAMGDIESSRNAKFSQPPQEKIKMAPDNVQGSTKASDMDLSGLFSMPEMPEDRPIKADTSYMKSPRQKREDDRSWETIENVLPKKR